MTGWHWYAVPCDVPGRLLMMPCPPADPEGSAFASLRGEGVDVVISMLARQEAEALGMAAEPVHCAGQGMTFLSHPIPDFGLPDPVVFDRLVADIKKRLLDGQRVAVHCRAGIGRSGMVAASVLVALGATASDAIARCSAARGVAIPDTAEQGEFIAFFERRVKRDGRARR